MIKVFSALMLFVLATPAMAANAESTLTGKTLIDADVVTVGDLFTNAGGAALHVLAPAPAIGQKLVLSAGDLSRVADAFKLNWPSRGGAAKIALERDASQVELAAITEALAKSDLKAKISENARFKIGNLDKPVIVAGQSAPELRILKTAFDPATENFSATLQMVRNDVVVKEIPLTGIATAMVKIPVLKFSMAANNTIGENDIIEMDFPKSQMRGDMVQSRDELVGMITRRTALANQGILRNDLTPPLMVKRNDIVTVTYKNGPVVLSTKARSLGNGTRGETMTFMNTTSKKPFEAKVTGPSQAEVNLNV